VSCFGGFSATFSVTSVSFLHYGSGLNSSHCKFSLHFCLLLHNFCHLFHLFFFFLQLHVYYELSILINWFEVLVYSSFLKMWKTSYQITKKWMCIMLAPKVRSPQLNTNTHTNKLAQMKKSRAHKEFVQLSCLMWKPST
jgi:hypothetical protein